MLDYTSLKDKGGLERWPDFKELPNFKVLEGDPVQEGRFDLGGIGMRTMAGVWQCSRGKFEATYPGDEICTLLEGHIRVTGGDGNVHDYRAGDTFYVAKGERVTWEVVEPVKKIFFIHDPDATQLAA